MNNWGHCKNCRHFGSPAQHPLGAEEASCRQPSLSQYQLRVYGSNGCNQWELRESLPLEPEESQYAHAPN